MNARLDLHRLLAMARKETIQLRRDTRSLILAFALPVFLLLLFGYAISWDVKDIPLGILDQDGTPQSRELVDAFRASGYFRLVARLDAPREADRLLTDGSALAVLRIPRGYADDLASGRSAPVQALVDGSDANTASIAIGYAEAIAARVSNRLLLERTDIRPPLSGELRVWYNEELSSRNMIVPGLVAVIMTIIAAMLTSLTVAAEWERGTMEQLVATPVSRLEVVLGKLLPYLVIGMVDVAVCSGLGIALFGVPFRGSPLLLAVLSFLFLVGALGLGLFISTAARSQLLATQLAMLLTFLPGFLLSGFMFAIAVMPKPLQAVTFIVPARYFLVVTRGIFLKGVGAEVLSVQAVLMVAFAVAGLGLAVRAFKKEIV
jgi:ABC-2 type transport system permease protein